ncbi:hypothetical protein CY34DRAFT_435685 [Suillus luteus UH-Slu-Lm8-n1]|uniref:Uncharacterized protein n=1 Tax=Suillus luteus UH-Slu-Lm8-n1 TaxID=930992 RepID=A0A0D0C2J3_9AGAM|nr:hypothetical protein CY34DRAFT_435685 [Suillus luteus UH-Slu-Lm8-n1]
MSPADGPKNGISNDIKYYTLQYLVTPLDTLTHRRRTFQPAVMESDSISYETIFDTMQLLHATRLPASQVWSSCSRCQSKSAIQRQQPSEISFSSPSVFYHVINICPVLSSRSSSSESLTPLWAPALASSGRSQEYSGIGSRCVLEGPRDASYIMGLPGTPISLEKISTHSDHVKFYLRDPTARCWTFFYQMRIPNLVEVRLETFNGDPQFYSTCKPHSDTTPKSRCVKKKNGRWLTCHNIQGLKTNFVIIYVP